MMLAFSAKGVRPSRAWMAALFLAGMGPAIARAQEVIPSPSASVGSSVRGPAPGPVVLGDMLDLEEPEGANPAVPRADGGRPRGGSGPGRDATARRDPRVDLRRGFTGRVAAAWPLDVLHRGLGPAVCQVAGGDQRGPQAELVRRLRRHLRAAQLAQFLLHGSHDHEPGVAVDSTPLGALEAEHQRQ